MRVFVLAGWVALSACQEAQRDWERVKAVQSLADRPAGALASARPGDFLIWNDCVSIVVGDGVLDAVPIGGEDGLRRMAASRLSGGYRLAVLGVDGLQIDAMEVANAYGGADFERVFADWLALVASGHRAAATGASDSHGRRSFAGHART